MVFFFFFLLSEDSLQTVFAVTVYIVILSPFFFNKLFKSFAKGQELAFQIFSSSLLVHGDRPQEAAGVQLVKTTLLSKVYLQWMPLTL